MPRLGPATPRREGEAGRRNNGRPCPLLLLFLPTGPARMPTRRRGWPRERPIQPPGAGTEMSSAPTPRTGRPQGHRGLLECWGKAVYFKNFNKIIY